MSLPRLIGITGAAGAGKDTVANALVAGHGFTRYGLADPIKKLLNERFGWTTDQWNDRGWKEQAEWDWGSGRTGDDARAAFSPRSWAQWLGTEVGRYIGGEDVWVNQLLRAWRDARYDDCTCTVRFVVPDVRFDNEAIAIRRAGGVILKVAREGAEQAVQAHISEAGVNFNYVDASIQAPYPGTEILIERALTALEWVNDN